MSGLCRELADTSKSPTTRQLAGICLKNAVVSKDALTQKSMAERWIVLPENTRHEIRNMVRYPSSLFFL